MLAAAVALKVLIFAGIELALLVEAAEKGKLEFNSLIHVKLLMTISELPGNKCSA